MLISALLYASILAALWQYGEGRRLSGTDVGRSVLLRHLSASSLIFAGKKHLLARARTRFYAYPVYRQPQNLSIAPVGTTFLR